MIRSAKVTYSLLAINVAVFLIQMLYASPLGGDILAVYGGLWPVTSNYFHVWQPFTYMFLHGNFEHLLFNMFSLWMFGRVIEQSLGTRRFITFYLVCGLGAGLCQILWQLFIQEGACTVGASGAIYGILLAFGMLYPNERIMLLIPPIPMKAKYFIGIFIVIELLFGIADFDNTAHFAHLGGMLFGFFLIQYWKRAARRPRKPKNKYENWHTADYDYNIEKRHRQERIDALLDKVRTSGYDSLTAEEKRDLFDFTR